MTTSFSDGLPGTRRCKSEKPTMLYHVPFALDREASSASGIRPVRMRDAFEAIGYRVLEVTGEIPERSHAAQKAIAYMRAGGRIAFAYSESSTMPTMLTTPSRMPTHPFLDLNLFGQLAVRKVPLGLFYRDVYWRYAEYRQRVGTLVSIGTRFFYGVDLLTYRATLTRIYLPSLAMSRYMLGVKGAQIAELPPGCELVANTPKMPGQTLELLYVGGLNNHYRMHRCVAAIATVSECHMILCTREKEWAEQRGSYAPFLSSKVEIVHESGEQIKKRMATADIGLLFVEPQPYRNFAVPFKLYEYLGNGLPIIATEGTQAGRIIKKNRVGWVIPYETAALNRLIQHLKTRPDEVRHASQRALSMAADNTWKTRACFVARDLMSNKTHSYQ